MRTYLAILLAFLSFAVCSPSGAHPPYGLVVDADGNVYFSDLETVWQLTPVQRLAIFRPHAPGTHVHELALTAEGSIEGDETRYDPVSERFYAGIWRRTIGGVEQAIVPMTDRPPLGAGVWQDRAGNRYTAQWISNLDRRTALLRRRQDGGVDVLFDEAGGVARPPQGSVASVGGMAFRADGTLFFAVGGVLRKVATDGTVSKLVDGGAGSNIRGIALASDGYVLAADMNSRTVVALGSNGKTRTLYRSRRGWVPTSVAQASGKLLVLEANADPYEREDRVRLIEVKHGRARVLAQPGQDKGGQELGQSSDSKGGNPSGTVLLATAVAVATLLTAWRFGSARRGGD